MAPNHSRGNDIAPVTINIGPNFDALADDSLNRKTAAVNQRINIRDMESATGTLDSLSCFVHGDAATDLETTSRLREGVPSLYTKPPTGIGSRGTAGRRERWIPSIPFLYLDNFATPPTLLCANRVPNEPFYPS
jgi:hypothetical protein